MRAQLTQRTLPSVVLGLLFLSTAAMGGCSGKYQALLGQLRAQADIMGNSTKLLDHYIHIQGLEVPGLQKHCKERPGTFPSEDALRGLSKQDFLQILDAIQDQVLHRLAAFQLETSEARDVAELHMVKPFIHGIKNNIYCMSRLLTNSSDTAEPTQASPGNSLPLTPSPDAFQRKIEGCKFLQGYHRFMRSVGQVLGEWEERPRRSRRHSPRRAPWKWGHRTRPSRRGRRMLPR
ncbi:oncostatin-M [Choloepus didactylus]|uniref:oncostatin-M n=1 Tax=Choloepus didactylus TaxID=27675 RepID=UPI00189FFB02|nr:oncostatin-M [Choloepus didactylus]